MIYKLQNGRTIPLGGDYLEYLQNTPEISGGTIQPSVKIERLPKKFNGSQQAARTYAEGYQKGAKPVTKAIDNVGQKIFNTTKNVAMFVPGPAGAITWLGQMGADTANGEYGKVVGDIGAAALMGVGLKGIQAGAKAIGRTLAGKGVNIPWLDAYDYSALRNEYLNRGFRRINYNGPLRYAIKYDLPTNGNFGVTEYKAIDALSGKEIGKLGTTQDLEHLGNKIFARTKSPQYVDNINGSDGNKGVSRTLYNAALNDRPTGLISGESLREPVKTESTWEHFPYEIIRYSGKRPDGGVGRVVDLRKQETFVPIFDDSVFKSIMRFHTQPPRYLLEGKTYHRLTERPSLVSVAEKAGIPKGERKYLADWTNWSKSTPISEKHLIEYSIIDNDLWRSKFKPFAGTDIRSHIQLRSKDAKKLDTRILFTGIEETINPNYNGILWTTRDGLSARAYAPSDEQVMQIVIPKDAKINTYDAKGNGWFEIDGKKLWDKGYRTNDFVNQSFDNGYDVAEIKRVVDIGPNHVPYSSKYNYFDNKLDFLERAPIQTDVIIKPGYPRKSIVGNNGDFDLSKQSLFEKRGGIIKGQNGFLNTWQKAYNSKFGKGLRNFMFGKDNDLSDEEYLEKYGYNKPVGGLGPLVEMTTIGPVSDFSGVSNIVKGTFGNGGVKASVGLQNLNTEKRALQLLKSYDEELKRDKVALEWAGKKWNELTNTEQYWLKVRQGHQWNDKLIIPRNI